ncbi:hypothetical protein FJN13_10175 [Alteromonas mediterranea]|uniref:Uncharacterized protein n=1 Tax=Alteromonas mediterranea TaxID=314275 RepID=A0AAC9JA97_9ALTE|nr:hypothetical protein [Alteromonas mediterranea]APD90134.1 hypothetical protein BM524_10215 [Alteromonas mediterranea]APE02211.1 hypothetical protein BM526_10350 [Alteromonas mediterranea]QDG35129.1 hypothetical protein FJN13_10175 [Alteromonas mediterranea]QDG38725.1 hypothetical protein FJN14_09825 [Alteromonas mediterranea]QGX62089.1 hypothetical protein FJN15_10135 [Alteromonas mediterranea]
MRLLLRLVSLAVAAYACYAGATTGEWKASIAIISLCGLVFLVSLITKGRGSKSGSHGDCSAAIYTPNISSSSSINSSSSCGSDAGGGGDC